MNSIVYIGMSVDGFIAKKDGNLDWLNNHPPTSDKSDYGWTIFLDRIDAVLMGRKTFEVCREFNPWPYSKLVFVLTTTMKDIPLHLEGKVELINPTSYFGKSNDSSKSFLSALLKDLHTNRGIRNLYIDGGRTIQSFIKEDLIDELVLTRIPVLLGDGIPLFGGNCPTMKLVLAATQTWDNGVIKTSYLRDRS